MAAATSISLLVYLTDIAKGLSDNDKLASLRDQLADVDGGEPQTILIIGSDKRLGMQGRPGPLRHDDPAARRPRQGPDRAAVDPARPEGQHPGVGIGKFNEAYPSGGPEALQVVKQLTGLDINHVVNINFTGFADAVDAIGCVYIDVDRHYYIPPERPSSTPRSTSRPATSGCAASRRSQYVRYRHTDNDLVRSARQQDFLREARQKLPPETLIRERNELLDIFTNTRPRTSATPVPLLELLKTFVGVQSAPVREVHFPAELGDGTSLRDRLAVGDQEGGRTVPRHRGHARRAPVGRGQPAGLGRRQGPGGGGKGGGKNKPGRTTSSARRWTTPPHRARSSAHQIAVKKRKDGKPMIDFPIYYPTRLVPGSTVIGTRARSRSTAPTRTSSTATRWSSTYRARRGFDEYYGVSGTDWVDAPILDNPSETRTIDGKEYLLFYDGDRLRLVGWKTKDAAYWVDNTLLQSLDEGQMLSIATSMREYTSKVASPDRAREREAADRRRRGRLGRPGDRGLLRRARPPGDRDGHRRGQGRDAARRRHAADPRARASPSCRPQPRAPRVHDRDGGGARAARGSSSAASTRRRRIPATPTSRGSRRSSRSCPTAASTRW